MDGAKLLQRELAGAFAAVIAVGPLLDPIGECREKSLILLALPRGLEPLFSP